MAKKVLILSNNTYDESFYKSRIEIDNKYEVTIVTNIDGYEQHLHNDDEKYDVIIVDYMQNQFPIGKLAQICDVEDEDTVKIVLADIPEHEQYKFLKKLGIATLMLYNPNNKPKNDFVENIDEILKEIESATLSMQSLIKISLFFILIILLIIVIIVLQIV